MKLVSHLYIYSLLHSNRTYSAECDRHTSTSVRPGSAATARASAGAVSRTHQLTSSVRKTFSFSLSLSVAQCALIAISSASDTALPHALSRGSSAARR